jgi:glyceraldehyde 3-phosphate dehydrogenase
LVNVAINGMGRIGRLVLKSLLKKDGINVVAVNVPRYVESVLFLLKHDSVHTHCNMDYSFDADKSELSIGGQKVKVFSEREPEKLPWKDLNVDLVVESTGKFRTMEEAGKHITAGAKKVVITAPGKSVDATIVMGINEADYDASKHNIISNASCTTNCLAPIVKVLQDKFGIKSGFMTTVHAYTGGQRILDGSHKDFRRARAAAMSIIPTTTGAAKAIDTQCFIG